MTTTIIISLIAFGVPIFFGRLLDKALIDSPENNTRWSQEPLACIGVIMFILGTFMSISVLIGITSIAMAILEKSTLPLMIIGAEIISCIGYILKWKAVKL